MTVTFRPPAVRAAPGLPATISLGRTEGTSRVVLIRGELDLSTRPKLSQVLSGLISTNTGDVIIDLGGTTFVDVAAVRTLATFRDLLARTGRTMAFRSPSTAVRKVITWSGLDDLIQDNPLCPEEV